MTTKTDFHSIMELKENFKMGWFSCFSMDAMSAICAVVDGMKMRRGLEV